MLHKYHFKSAMHHYLPLTSCTQFMTNFHESREQQHHPSNMAIPTMTYLHLLHRHWGVLFWCDPIARFVLVILFLLLLLCRRLLLGSFLPLLPSLSQFFVPVLLQNFHDLWLQHWEGQHSNVNQPITELTLNGKNSSFHFMMAQNRNIYQYQTQFIMK